MAPAGSTRRRSGSWSNAVRPTPARRGWRVACTSRARVFRCSLPNTSPRSMPEATRRRTPCFPRCGDCSSRGSGASAMWLARFSAPLRRSAGPSSWTSCAQASGRTRRGGCGGAGGARVARRGAGGLGTRARLRLLTREAPRAGLRADRPRAAPAAARARRGRHVGAPRRRERGARRPAPAPGGRAGQGRGAVPPCGGARRVAAGPRRRTRALRGGDGAWFSRHRRAPRAHRRPAHARRRLRRRNRELRERRGHGRRGSSSRRSSRSSAACMAGEASGGAPRPAWRGARRRAARFAGAQGTHRGRPRTHNAPGWPLRRCCRDERQKRSSWPTTPADRPGQAQAHNMLGVLARSRGRPRRRAGGARAEPRVGGRAGGPPGPRRSTTSRWWSETPASSSGRAS